MQGNRKTGTRPEAEVRKRLYRMGLRYRKNWPLRTRTTAVTPDIVFIGARVAVFIDGCFWHCCPEHFRMPQSNTEYWEAKLTRNRARDREVEEALAEDGWRVARFWEHVLPEVAADEIACLVSRAAPRHDSAGQHGPIT